MESIKWIIQEKNDSNFKINQTNATKTNCKSRASDKTKILLDYDKKRKYVYDIKHNGTKETHTKLQNTTTNRNYYAELIPYETHDDKDIEEVFYKDIKISSQNDDTDIDMEHNKVKMDCNKDTIIRISEINIKTVQKETSTVKTIQNEYT